MPHFILMLLSFASRIYLRGIFFTAASVKMVFIPFVELCFLLPLVSPLVFLLYIFHLKSSITVSVILKIVFFVTFLQLILMFKLYLINFLYVLIVLKVKCTNYLLLILLLLLLDLLNLFTVMFGVLPRSLLLMTYGTM
jgi:hypothetical protein